MNSMKISIAFLLASVILSGFMAGIGFVNLIGFIPSFRDTASDNIIPYWQVLDGYMSERMPIFGSFLLLAMVGAGIFLARQSWKQPLWCMMIAIGFIIADIAVANIYNLPFNRILQSITVETIPPGFEYMREKAMLGFTLRGMCAIASFVAVVGGFYLQVKHISHSIKNRS